MDYIQAIGGLILLIVAGDMLVRGGVSLAQRLGISPMVIGLTIIAFGTSAPELMVGIDAVLKGAPTLALGNVVGSNIANILLVLGVPALIAPIACNAPRIGRNFMIMAAITVLFIMMAQAGSFQWIQGLVLLAILTTFLYYSATRSKLKPEGVDPLEELDGLEDGPDSMPKSIIYTIIGLFGLAAGAEFLVTGSVSIARGLGVSEALIGLTLVAIGTSLPELVTSITAAKRGHSDVAVGNVIGSNIFNLLAIIGFSSLFGEIPVTENFKKVDLWVMLVSVIALAPFCALKTRVKKTAGIFMLVGYAAYILYLAQSVL